LSTSEYDRFFEDPLKLGLSQFHDETEIPSCDKTTLGNWRQPPHDFRSAPFSFSTLPTYVQSKFSAPSLHDNDNGTKAATAPTIAEKNEKSGIEFGRTSKELVARRESRKRRRKSEGEKGGHRVAPRLDLEGELKIVSDYTNVVESILSIAVASRRAEGERSGRTAPFESGMESSNSSSRYVPFRPIS
ncbi:hypothetical protein ALC56_10076, partial [Trachymyrmex septentrionalis]